MSMQGPQGFWSVLLFWIVVSWPCRIAAGLLILIPLAIWPLTIVKMIGVVVFTLICFLLLFMAVEYSVKKAGLEWTGEINTIYTWSTGFITIVLTALLIWFLFFLKGS